MVLGITCRHGTIVHNSLNMTRPQFEQVVMKTSEIWKQCSHEIRSHVSAENIGIAVQEIRDSDSTILASIYDIEPSRGPRTLYYYRWSIPTNSTNTTILKSSRHWSATRACLIKALENHVGAVDPGGSLVMLSRPRPHTLYSAFKETERIFAYDKGIKSHAMSVVLDQSTLLSPIPGLLLESDAFLSMTIIVWQWLQQERGLRGEAPSGMTHVRIMYAY